MIFGKGSFKINSLRYCKGSSRRVNIIQDIKIAVKNEKVPEAKPKAPERQVSKKKSLNFMPGEVKIYKFDSSKILENVPPAFSG